MHSSYSHQQHCQCGQVVFFDNTTCLRCGCALGFHPQLGRVVSLVAEPQSDQWRVTANQERVQRCANLDSPAECNWLVGSSTQAPPLPGDLCIACALNVTIPDLSQTQNADWWRQCEQAKRRLIAQLLALGLPVENRAHNPAYGMGFKLLRWQEGEPPITTGHKNGIITLDIAEADHAFREDMRQRMGEPYRTLLGHFRHESGHYYWDRLVAQTSWLPLFRQVFGDERQHYTQSLQSHYQSGPPPDWQQHYISHYAAAHPWEDWAETWAHLLHLIDTLSAAAEMGVTINSLSIATDSFTHDTLSDLPFFTGERAGQFLLQINQWVKLSSTLNVLARSMGQTDIYPFVLTRRSVQKLFMVSAIIG